DRRVVDQGRRQVAAHALAEAELAHRRADKVVQVEQLAEARQVGFVARALDSIHLGNQLERLDQGEVPPELAALAEHDADVERILLALAPGNQPGYLDGTRRRRQDASEHFDRRRLAGAVWADIAKQLALVDAEADAVDRALERVLACEQGAQAA